MKALVVCADAQFKAGIDALAIGEGGAGRNMLSPGMHEMFLLDVHRRTIDSTDGPVIMHICGDIAPRLDSLAQIGLTCFNFDWDVRPEAMKKASQERFAIMGYVNTTDLRLSDPAEIERQVTENLDAGVDIISSGCAISPECPNVNLRAMSGAVQTRQQRG